MDNAKLYVGNLDYSFTSEQLNELFVKVGEVIEAVVITDRQTGRSKGFGFVTMATPELAQAAITEYNGKEIDGRVLNVNEARPRKERF
ncbi:RNA-binding protein [Patescibacteria group bacterium]|nr:RNA-binding protein [Patescibacteria group bacterium]